MDVVDADDLVEDPDVVLDLSSNSLPSGIGSDGQRRPEVILLVGADRGARGFGDGRQRKSGERGAAARAARRPRRLVVAIGRRASHGARVCGLRPRALQGCCCEQVCCSEKRGCPAALPHRS